MEVMLHFCCSVLYREMEEKCCSYHTVRRMINKIPRLIFEHDIFIEFQLKPHFIDVYIHS